MYTYSEMFSSSQCFDFIPSDIAKKVSDLSRFSKSCGSDAKDVNTSPGYAKALAVAVFITLIIYMRFWWP